MAEVATERDPRKHFAYPGCVSCPTTPCERLRCSGETSGVYFVSRRDYSPHPCPFAVQSSSELLHLCLDIPGWRLEMLLGGLLGELPPTVVAAREKSASPVPAASPDAGGMLRKLCEDNFAVAIRTPPHQQRDEKVRSWISPATRQVFRPDIRDSWRIP